MSRRPSHFVSQLVATVLFFGWLVAARAVLGAGILPGEYRPDQIIIQPKAGASGPALAAFHAAHAAAAGRVFAAAGGSQVVTLPSGETVPGLIAKYEASGLVEFAEPDYLVHATATVPNDPLFGDGTLWALNNTGQNGGTANADIDAPEAWDVLNSASNIVVAVVDTGIRWTHEDLAANMWVNPNDGGHGFNAFTGTNDPADDGGHGTLMAGVIGGVGNNGKGVAGVAWRVQMMACKGLDKNGNGSDSTVIACIDYARTHGAQIINSSLDSPTYSSALSNAIVAVHDAGILFVCSAGNNGVNLDVTPHYPACYNIDNIIAVAATTRNDVLWNVSAGNGSDYGATNVALAAPGDQITSTFSSSDTSYFPSAGLPVDVAGTSFSSAYVSGAVALMLAKYPTENYHQIKQRLLAAVDVLPALSGKCATGGRLNLKKALHPEITLAPVTTGSGGTVQIRLSAWQNRTCTIQLSTNLTDWSAIYTNTTSTNGIFDFTNSTGTPQQYFRAVAAP
ncbi:MAG TPA: S8 family serine peptidase [Candidatus Acidoferrales bacterium]|nr:S8 family serine peptidase [Candidatus Acidoferrales bacterium]